MVAFEFSNINSALLRKIGPSYINSRFIILCMRINNETLITSKV